MSEQPKLPTEIETAIDRALSAHAEAEGHSDAKDEYAQAAHRRSLDAYAALASAIDRDRERLRSTLESTLICAEEAERQLAAAVALVNEVLSDERGPITVRVDGRVMFESARQWVGLREDWIARAKVCVSCEAFLPQSKSKE